MIGMVGSTLAGLTILMPGMGGSFFAAKKPKPAQTILYVTMAHGIFAAVKGWLWH